MHTYIHTGGKAGGRAGGRAGRADRQTERASAEGPRMSRAHENIRLHDPETKLDRQNLAFVYPMYDYSKLLKTYISVYFYVNISSIFNNIL